MGSTVSAKVSSSDYPAKANAEALIEYLYREKKRKTGEPYTNHMYAVRDILMQAGVTDKTLLITSLLHDVLEDTDLSKDYINFRFGKNVANIVELLSKDRLWGTSYCRIKSSMDTMEAAWMEYPEAMLIKIADRLHNLQTIHGFTLQKQKRYIAETKECLVPAFEKAVKLNHIGRFNKPIKYIFKKLLKEIKTIETNNF